MHVLPSSIWQVGMIEYKPHLKELSYCPANSLFLSYTALKAVVVMADTLGDNHASRGI